MANNTMTKLATTTVGSGGASSVTFSAIPQNYTDLVVKASTRCDGAVVDVLGALRFNNDAGNNYQDVEVYGTGSSASSLSHATSFSFVINTTGTSATSNTFGNSEFYISNYTSANFKSFSNDSTPETNGSTFTSGQALLAGLWKNTAPITSIQIFPGGGYNFVQYSEFTLYGVYAGGTTTPSAPTIASATDLGGGTAQVTISSPAAIPYTVTSSPDGITATGMSPINISGLSPQTSYTFTAQAVAPFGVSAASSASSSVSMYNGMTALATTTLGSGGASTITFSSIPSGYSHLQIRGVSKSNITGTGNRYAVQIQFNGDTSSSYAMHQIYGDGSGVSVFAYASQNAAEIVENASNDTANVFGATVIDILDYSNTNKYKTVRALSGVDANGAGRVALGSGLWMNTSAVTSITLLDYGQTLMQYSTFVLYGVK